MGRVWRARDELLDREVAVKEIVVPHGLVAGQRELMIRRVMREARSAGRLNHPGIITVHDVAEHDGAPFIVMELIAGRSPATLIEEKGRLPAERVAAIGAAMLDALQEAHAAGITRRDIKPDNVLITDRRTIITDFGIASMIDATALTSPGSAPGTPAYMSPEQLEGRAATSASDLCGISEVGRGDLAGTGEADVGVMQYRPDWSPAKEGGADAPPCLAACAEHGGGS
jgi:serine/threonine protein kinase